MTPRDDVFAMDNLALFERHGAKAEARSARAGCWVVMPNGWTLSIQWDRGNYGSNYDAERNDGRDAHTAEVAAWPKNGSMVVWEDGGDTVLGWCTVARVQHILDLLAEDKLLQDYQPPMERRAVDNWAEVTA